MGGESKNGKVPLISKIAYGFGDVGCNFSWMFVSNLQTCLEAVWRRCRHLCFFQDSGMQSMIQSSGDLRIKQNRDGDGTVHGC